MNSHNSKVEHNDKFRIVLVYSFLAVFSLICFSGVNIFVISDNLNETHDNFSQQTNDAHQHLLLVTQSTHFILDSFSALLSGVGFTSYETIVRYSKEVLERVPHIYQIQAAQHVRRRNLKRFNEEQSAFSDFHVRVFDGSSFKTAYKSKKDAFYPITFFADKEDAPFNNLGIDVLSLPFLATPTLLAEKQNKTAISEPFDTLDDERVFVMIQPAFFSETNRADFFVFFVIKASYLLNQGTKLTDHSISISLKENNENPLLVQQQKPVGYLAKLLLPLYQYEKEIIIGKQTLVLNISKQLNWSAIAIHILLAIFTGSSLLLFAFYFMFKIHFNSEILKTKHSEQLYQLANFDPLTKLANRRYFESAFEHSLKLSLRRKSTVGILYLDLDGFKAINDTLGHQIGDEALIASANKITANLRDTDIVGRLGGDEFAIILNDIVDEQLCHEIQQRIEKSISEIKTINEKNINLGVSIGFAIYPRDALLADELLILADQRMYENKRHRKEKQIKQVI